MGFWLEFHRKWLPHAITKTFVRPLYVKHASFSDSPSVAIRPNEREKPPKKVPATD